MAFYAITDGKGSLPVMAGAARFALIHVGHGVMGVFLRFAVVAGLATEIRGCPAFFLQVNLVTENHFAGILGVVGNVL
jgi:hypothetical protein